MEDTLKKIAKRLFLFYDSAGLFLFLPEGKIMVVKKQGKI
jgi:hypothetical protein